jgi:hypothetical protein
VELGRVALACKAWKEASEDNRLWIRYFNAESSLIPKGVSLKSFYIVRERILNSFFILCYFDKSFSKINHQRCARNWLNGKYKSFQLPNEKGGYHLCEIFNNDTLVTGTTSGLEILFYTSKSGVLLMYSQI